MDSTLKTRNILIAGRRTSVRLEPAMWRALVEIARHEHCSIHDVCTRAAVLNAASTLTAGLRVYIMEYYRDLATSAGLIETARTSTGTD